MIFSYNYPDSDTLERQDHPAAETSFDRYILPDNHHHDLCYCSRRVVWHHYSRMGC